MRTLFALTLLVSASLLFVVQPMLARMVLPMLGGSPAVWNTCMVFFQTALLAGYAYAHASSALLGVRVQALVHLGLLLLALLCLPIAIPTGWVRTLGSEANPSFSLLGALVVSVGLPFFVVSSTAPLLQRWFAGTDHPSASDPYFLYGASNVGSMVALVGYPFVIEPNLRLAAQSRYWAVGYLLLVGLIVACVGATWRSKRGPFEENRPEEITDRPGLGRVAGWVALAFIPSSLMLGVTTYLTTDLAAIPLLWVVPLALYLLTFILIFARRQILPLAWINRAQPFVLIILALLIGLNSVQAFMIPVHLIAFFVIALVCHGELVRCRPPARYLTGFYLAMSFGGALGGVFNALIAPVTFDWVAEYPIAVVLAALVRPGRACFAGSARSRILDVLAPAFLTLALVGVSPWLISPQDSNRPGLGVVLAAGLVALVCFSFKGRPVRFALGIGAALLACHLTIGDRGHTIYRERNFFGVARVWEDNDRSFHRLTHGNTRHGQQSTDPGLRREPLTYYHRTGPIGQVMPMVSERSPNAAVAIVGLGAGTLACYARRGQDWTFFEIDPAIEQIARDPRCFTYLEDCRARSWRINLGDARLKLRDSADARYAVIVLDAFSSDAIPVHLITREALALYRTKLAPGGVLAFHISNRYIDLAPVLGVLAADAGLIARFRHDGTVTTAQAAEGKTGSTWLVMASRLEDLGPLANDPGWTEPRFQAGESVWTDDFSDVIRHIKIRP